jgi:hypothetical protein
MSDGQRTQIKISGLVASVPDRDARPDLLQPGQQERKACGERPACANCCFKDRRAPEGASSSLSRLS